MVDPIRCPLPKGKDGEDKLPRLSQKAVATGRTFGVALWRHYPHVTERNYKRAMKGFALFGGYKESSVMDTESGLFIDTYRIPLKQDSNFAEICEVLRSFGIKEFYYGRSDKGKIGFGHVGVSQGSGAEKPVSKSRETEKAYRDNRKELLWELADIFSCWEDAFLHRPHVPARTAQWNYDLSEAAATVRLDDARYKRLIAELRAVLKQQQAVIACVPDEGLSDDVADCLDKYLYRLRCQALRLQRLAGLRERADELEQSPAPAAPRKWVESDIDVTGASDRDGYNVDHNSSHYEEYIPLD